MFSSLATEADLEALIAEQRDEDLHLEFKQKEDRRNGDIMKNDKQGFSKAMSGFANADGGILIFGMETTKSQDGVDRATSLKPITEHDRFRAKLMDSILNTTQPVVDDVRIEIIDSAQGAGYVKCLIPQSVKQPHRAMLADKQYWRRVSTGHRLMEHYELEDIFGRRLRPSLKMSLELKPRPDDDPHEDLHFALLNEGRGLAHHVGFLCKPSNAIIMSAIGHGVQNVSAANAGTPAVSYYDAHSVVHANGIYLAVGHTTILRREAKGTPLPIEVIWYAENMDTRRAVLELSAGQKYLVS
ncbi:MAG: ATP-binding protein [Hyphomicrobium sp.]